MQAESVHYGLSCYMNNWIQTLIFVDMSTFYDYNLVCYIEPGPPSLGKRT